MTLTSKFSHKPSFVDAALVTEENMKEVAEWCNGTILTFDETEKVKNVEYIKVRVQHPISQRQTKAFVGDFVLYGGKSFKVYPEGAFHRTFDSVFLENADGPVEIPQPSDTLPEPGVAVHVATEQEIVPGVTATRIEEANLSVSGEQIIGQVTDIRESEEGLEFDFTVNSAKAAEAASRIAGATPKVYVDEVAEEPKTSYTKAEYEALNKVNPDRI